MSIVDVEKIINGTPKKRLINGFNKMKENYTEASAQEYFNIYSNEPLSFLLENSEMIFTEPYCGYQYYKEAVLNPNHCLFNSLVLESEKVSSYIEERGSLMSTEQKSMYDELQSGLQSMLENTYNTRLYASYIRENNHDDFETRLSNDLFSYERADEKSEEDIISLFKENMDSSLYFTYAPYAIACVESCGGNSTEICNLVKEYCTNENADTDPESWKSYVEKVVCENKLHEDVAYLESVQKNPIKMSRIVFEYYMESSISSMIHSVLERPISKHEFVASENAASAVNNIFFDMYESAINEGEYQAEKEKSDTFKGIAMEAVLEIMLRDYQTCNDTADIAKGYSILKEACSIEEAFEKVNEEYESTVGYLMSESEDDVSDDDLSNMENDINDKTDDVKDNGTTGKKPVAPKPKNLANRIQFNAMDKEAAQKKKMAIRGQKGQEIKNAIRATAQIPLNVLNSIKGQVHKIDEADDERRKKYLTEPGFRKKAFRNMKLAILYGTAANFKLSFIPVVAISRHYSKQKDRRMQNELVRELNTEIKVCEEKISDANANNDNKEKYRLIRIKDQLDAEMVRVQTNSKFV